MAFKPMSRPVSTQERPAIQTVNTVVEPDCGMQWINGKLGSTSNETHLRLLPYFDENGEILDAFDPNGQTIAGGNSIDCLGMMFRQVEIASMYINRTRYNFITTLKNVDSNGRPVPSDKHTPAHSIISRLHWILWKNVLLTERGYPAIVPEEWMQLRTNEVIKSMASCPRPMLLVRALPLMIDGQRISDPVPGIYAIPGSAEAGFLSNITSKRDPNGPLIASNMFAHWNVTDPYAGYILRVQKVATKANNNQPATQGGYAGNQQHQQRGGFHGKDKGKTDYLITTMEPYALSDDYLNWLRNSQRSWEEVLHYPTVEESIQLMVDLLGPAAVDFGLRKTAYAKYLPPGVAGAASHIVDEPRTPTQLKELPALVPTQKVHTYAPQEQYGNQAQQPQGYTPQGYAAPAPQGYAAPSPQGYSAPAPQPPPAPSRQPNYQANQGFVAPQGYTQPAVAPQEYAQPRQTAPLGHAQPAAAPQAYAQPAPQGYAQPAPQAYAQPRQAVHQPPAVPFQEQLPHMGEPLQQTAHNSRPSALPNVEDLEEYPEEESGSMQINIDGQERTIQKPVGANAIQERIARVASLKNNK